MHQVSHLMQAARSISELLAAAAVDATLAEAAEQAGGVKKSTVAARTKTRTKRTLSEAGRRAIGRATKKRWADARKAGRSVLGAGATKHARAAAA